ncbi:alpha/beta-hydrolase [Dothidotthia symphoricarpi CBS 119687]|uniref:Alpha/beta-hydrolase n=1 Tax=Dothidotthia symphoricarpi CBS 119687 TaxID=1392245 RepID=A0A6A5ZYY9_9PLEO|nr:alpha/beta-hydrolase [Dothidotthia symphoricarpi CBS 119687]KAF2123977.1 alpha/beta-hydrolase [Dothidotthia symphoricarpi CBS 119687]
MTSINATPSDPKPKAVFHASTPSAPILIYLPPGPVVPDSSEEQGRVISTLRASSDATVVRINYRASAEHQYPTPYHDALFGYDWISENLLRDEFKRPHLARLGVCGELVGGSIATMLALTECRNKESRIAAAAVNNPIADWVFHDDLPLVHPSELPEPASPDETSFPADEDPGDPTSPPEKTKPVSKAGQPRKKRAPKLPPPTAWQLHGDNEVLPTSKLSVERNFLFRGPEDFFDRFASPIHFFRSPRAQLIYPPSDDVSASEQPDDQLDMEAQMLLGHYTPFKSKAKASTELPVLSRCRAYIRSYPPAGVNLSLPVWNITAGTDSPLADQTSELAKMLRRSVARHTLKARARRVRWLDPAEKAQYEEMALERVHLDLTPGIGLWTQQDDDLSWKSQVEGMGAWLKHSLK